MPGAPFGRSNAVLLLLNHSDYLHLGKMAISHSPAHSRLDRLYIRLRDFVRVQVSGGIKPNLRIWEVGPHYHYGFKDQAFRQSRYNYKFLTVFEPSE